MYYVLMLIIGLIVGFGVGMGVYFYNRKHLESDIEMYKNAYESAKGELEKDK